MVSATELFETGRVLLSGPKLERSSGDTPSWVERQSLNQRLHESAVLREEVDVTSAPARYGIRDVSQAVDVLNAERGEG